MTRRFGLALVALVSVSACTRLTPEQQFLSDAATALGGRERILAAKTLLLEGTGTQYNLGQDVVPGASGQTFTVSAYRRAVDLAGGRTRVELTRKPNFTFFQGPAAQTQVQGLDGAVGYNVAPNGNATRVPDTAAADRRAELQQHPLLALRAALDPMATLSNLRTDGGESILDVTSGGQTFTLAIDAATKLPSRVSATRYNVNLGDVAISTTFGGYEAVNGLQMPASLVSRTDDFTTAEITVTTQSVDADTGDLAAPAAAASAPAVSAPAPPMVTAQELSKGIWMLGGGSHHSYLVEFADHLMLIEAPQNEARALAVIAKARELRPGKPLTQLVNSHHHFDHTGGVRAAIAEGLSVITHQGNVAFFEAVAKRAHTVVPDALAKSPKPLAIEGVSDRKTISDGTMSVDLYTVAGPHSSTMLMAHFPKERLLVEGDVYTPGGAVQMYAGAFLEEVKKRNLRIDRIAPLHGAIGPYAQFLKEAAAPLPES
jgi:glyoxylase-like metal-dependent hydrolase (beta-lactamase superfamily II)